LSKRFYPGNFTASAPSQNGRRDRLEPGYVRKCGAILVPTAIRRPSDVNGASAGQRRRTLHCIVLRRSISRLFRPAHRCNLNANTLALSTLRRGAASSAF
jgi:hypothetical protein